MEYLHYIHGVNPLGLVYLTNMKKAGASHSASTMFHNWFAHGTRWERVSERHAGSPAGISCGGSKSILFKRQMLHRRHLNPGYRCFS